MTHHPFNPVTCRLVTALSQVDTAEHNRDATLVMKILEEDEILNLFWFLFAFSMMSFGTSVAISGKAHLFPYVVFFKCLILSYNYSGGMELKYNAMGEIIVFFIFGPGVASFIYTCMSNGMLSIKLMFLSSPMGLLAASVVLANNIKNSGMFIKSVFI